MVSMTSGKQARLNFMPNIVAIIRYALCALFLLHAGSARGASESAIAASEWVDTEYASVRLISATDSVGDADIDHPLTLGLEFQLQEGWKIYWRSPGDAGYPPQPNWSTSSNIWSIDMRWPAPVRFSVLGFETLGYKHEVVFPLTVTPLQPGQAVQLGVQLDYLICSEVCVPESVSLSLDIPAGDGTPSTFVHLINKYTVQVPGDGKASGLTIDTLELVQQPDQNPQLLITASSLNGMTFDDPDVYLEGPLDDPGTLGFGKPLAQVDPSGTTATLQVELVGTKDTQGNAAALLDKEFTVTLIAGARSVERTIQVSPNTSPILSKRVTAQLSIVMILLFAFAGGLILNLMPCVLPVLSIKLLGVISHGGGQSKDVRISFIASAAGIVASFMLIAVALAALKASGIAIGWGIQFQQPIFLITMAVIITVFACNLWGWFEFSTPGAVAKIGTQTSGITGHFMTGMLATLLATPCSAPFLGTAVGFALSRGTPEIMGIFLVLGLGLAAPYLVVAAAPRLATMLPKPGNWMITLRRFLGLALAGTVLWLLSVLLVQLDTLITVLIGAGLTAAGASLYLWHRGALTGKQAMAVVMISWIGAIGLSHMPTDVSTDSASSAVDDLWQPFDLAAIDTHVANGKTVFVDVTAEWCVSCLVNKAFVLSRGTVLERLSSDAIIPMQADWTLPKDSITRYLTSFQRYGIPFNAVYGPGAPDGIVLPEILTPGAVLDALDAAQD
ncbi:MAG: hypothetical protein HOC63_16585 [Rhodospirillales bacterium]|jgi:suppressor for copper-sensitivity B|nr:hypothetical protein [Rhodospirillales bacterium]MBT4628293.1 hypothetical protein [Rhodospirillales bacterium]MBT5352307.1 hypothetical protein [Rhodospirillales bacterium]MBT5521044.1 hypothetical protein [Rhodospirillales bacterium]MBT6109155.1 hypothetical protein [Rhodospirillales bacterium]